MANQGKPQDERKITRTVSMELGMVTEIEDYAQAEGHSNFSKVVVTAVREFFARLRGEKEAA